ncbi:hypothetical protein QTP88_007396 [Uroleucon formosanum]
MLWKYTKANSKFKSKSSGTVDQPWFRVKDIFEILGYKAMTMKKMLQKTDKKFKSNLSTLMVGVLKTPTPSYNECKEIYVNEIGLYFLIIKSRLKTAKNFQIYVCEVVLPGIRKIIQGKYENEIKELKSQNNKIISTIKETNIKLDDINNKLSKTLPDRNVDPTDKELKHYYILFKRKDSLNEYMFVRGQEKYIKIRKNLYKTEFDIIIYSKKNPNPIDLMNRLKDFVNKIVLILWIILNVQIPTIHYLILKNAEKF